MTQVQIAEHKVFWEPLVTGDVPGFELRIGGFRTGAEEEAFLPFIEEPTVIGTGLPGGDQLKVASAAGSLKLFLPSLVITDAFPAPPEVAIPKADEEALVMTPEMFAMTVRRMLREMDFQAYALAVYSKETGLEFAVAFYSDDTWWVISYENAGAILRIDPLSVFLIGRGYPYVYPMAHLESLQPEVFYPRIRKFQKYASGGRIRDITGKVPEDLASQLSYAPRHSVTLKLEVPGETRMGFWEKVKGVFGKGPSVPLAYELKVYQEKDSRRVVVEPVPFLKDPTLIENRLEALLITDSMPVGGDYFCEATPPTLPLQ